VIQRSVMTQRTAVASAAGVACAACRRTPQHPAFDASVTRRLASSSASADRAWQRKHVDELAVLLPHSTPDRQIPRTLFQTSSRQLLSPTRWSRTTSSRQSEIVRPRAFYATCRVSASPNHNDDFVCWTLYNKKTQEPQLSQRGRARCFVSLNVSLSHSRTFEMTPWVGHV